MKQPKPWMLNVLMVLAIVLIVLQMFSALVLVLAGICSLNMPQIFDTMIQSGALSAAVGSNLAGAELTASTFSVWFLIMTVIVMVAMVFQSLAFWNAYKIVKNWKNKLYGNVRLVRQAGKWILIAQLIGWLGGIAGILALPGISINLEPNAGTLSWIFIGLMALCVPQSGPVLIKEE